MKVAIVGPGALGCLFGGRLAAGGHHVWLLHHRDAAARRLSRAGITITSPGADSFTADVTATTTATDIGAVDLVVVLVRAHQTSAALSEHAACIGPETVVLSLQNGLHTYDTLLDHVPQDRALGGVTYEAASMDEPGIVTHTSAGETTIGGATPDVRTRIQAVLVGAGFEVRTVDNPRPIIWEKGALVAATAPVLTLTDCPVDALSDAPLTGIVDRLLAEAGQIAASQGIDLDVAAIQQTIESVADSHGGHRVSMAQDVAQGRRTEIDTLNGALIELAEAEGIAVPANTLVTALIHGLEQCSIGDGPTVRD